MLVARVAVVALPDIVAFIVVALIVVVVIVPITCNSVLGSVVPTPTLPPAKTRTLSDPSVLNVIYPEPVSTTSTDELPSVIASVLTVPYDKAPEPSVFKY